MSASGFSVGTFTGGGTFGVEVLGGTITPVGVAAWGGAGTVTRVGPSMAAAMPVGIYGGTFNAGTVDRVGTVQAGTLDMLKAGTVSANQPLGQGKTLAWGTISLASGSVALVTPGTGTTAYIVGITVSAGTVGAFNFAQGNGAPLLSGTITVDQYGGFVDRGQPSAPILKGAAGSVIYLNVLSGTPNLGGYFSYFVE